jgi:prepilin-type N-terminal cleavage/methylation domain-containing protein
MKKTFSSKKSAFSLIELSIVLIIIGLLIAGITGGASLIKSSELRSVMSEARSYAVGVNAFYTQFGALPGDFGTAIVGSDAVGNGDGRIEHNSGTVAEGSEAWRDLKAIGAIDNTLTYITYSSGVAQMTPGTHLPLSKIKSSGWAFDYNTTSSQNVVVLTGTVGAASGTTNTVVNGTEVATGAILPTDALSIDTKIDDGIANTGNVRGVISTCFDTADYEVATQTKVCALSYRVDVNS